jgi:hypothetical protein
MFKSLTVLAALTLGAVSSFATASLTGSFKWVSGTLTSNVTTTAVAQTVVLDVAGKSTTFSNTFLPGPVGTEYYSGTTIEILESGSIPFGGTYPSGATLSAFVNYDNSNASRRTVSISTTGAIASNIGLPVYDSEVISFDFYLPGLTISGVNFPNGVSEHIGAAINSYSIPLPTSSSTTSFAVVTFPGTAAPLNQVQFNGFGNGTFLAGGSGTGHNVEIASTATGSPTTITAANFTITSGN